MNFLGVGTGELLLILLIALLVLGPERIPDAARYWAKFTKTIQQFSRIWYDFNAELNRQLQLDEQDPPKTKPKPPAPPAVSEAQEFSNTIAPPELAAPDATETGAATETGPAEPMAGESAAEPEEPDAEVTAVEAPQAPDPEVQTEAATGPASPAATDAVPDEPAGLLEDSPDE
jgi:sec-independent protein translocase protein TatB